MTDFPAERLPGSPQPVLTIGATQPIGCLALINGAGANAARTMTTANTAVYMPVLIPRPMTIYQMSILVTTQSGNVDVGIYDEAGNRLVSSGSTLVAGAGLQVFNITDTPLAPGVYYVAAVADGTTAAFRSTAGVVVNLRPSGVREQASAFPLPSTATFAVLTSLTMPGVALHPSAATI